MSLFFRRGTRLYALVDGSCGRPAEQGGARTYGGGRRDQGRGESQISHVQTIRGQGEPKSFLKHIFKS